MNAPHLRQREQLSQERQQRDTQDSTQSQPEVYCDLGLGRWKLSKSHLIAEPLADFVVPARNSALGTLMTCMALDFDLPEELREERRREVNTWRTHNTQFMVYKDSHGYRAEWEPATEYIRKSKWINGQEPEYEVGLEPSPPGTPDSADDNDDHGPELEVVFDLSSPATPDSSTHTSTSPRLGDRHNMCKCGTGQGSHGCSVELSEHQIRTNGLCDDCSGYDGSGKCECDCYECEEARYNQHQTEEAEAGKYDYEPSEQQDKQSVAAMGLHHQLQQAEAALGLNEQPPHIGPNSNSVKAGDGTSSMHAMALAMAQTNNEVCIALGMDLMGRGGGGWARVPSRFAPVFQASQFFSD